MEILSKDNNDIIAILDDILRDRREVYVSGRKFTVIEPMDEYWRECACLFLAAVVYYLKENTTSENELCYSAVLDFVQRASQLAELADTDYCIDLNQGMDIRLLTDDVCRLLKKIRWIKYIRFSCDSCSQLPYFERAAEMFERHRISKSKIFIYILVRSDLQEADFRVQELNKLCKNFNLYAQAERNGRNGVIPNTAQLEFAQRYVYGKCYKKENWREYCQKRGFDF